jgi:hypothetical protein
MALPFSFIADPYKLCATAIDIDDCVQKRKRFFAWALEGVAANDRTIRPTITQLPDFF